MNHSDPDDKPTEEFGLSRGERSLIRRMSEVLKFGDFTALLMVVATVLSAFATWRTASITNLLFTVSERPYVGIEGIAFDSIDSNSARLRIDLRNFGHVSATDGVARIWILVDGHRLQKEDGPAATVNFGMVSPSVPQLSYRFIPANVYGTQG
jgi:hypothetical protein